MQVMRSPRVFGAALSLFLAAACAPQRPAAMAQPVCAPPAAPAPAAPSEAAEPAISRLLAEQSDAWNRHDAKAWVASFSEDAEFINILGMLLVGRSEIERRHAEIFKTIFARSRVVVSVRKVRPVGPNAAVAETEYELRDYDRLPPSIQPTDPDGTLRTRLKYVFELTPAGWRIVAAQNTAILPPRAPLPPEPKP
jgi:uncharacterized protein (TIGR02246 family)